VDSDEVDENGRTSVTPPPWWELAGRERVAALLAAARTGDTADRTGLRAAALPVIRFVVDASELSGTERDAVVQAVSRRLLQEATGSRTKTPC
jgi:hypothetical protein